MIVDTGKVQRLRLLVIALLCAIWSASPVVAQQAPPLLQRPARLNVEGVSLEEALLTLQGSSGVTVVFSPDLLPGVRVSCRCEGSTVRQALDRILVGTSLTYALHGGRVLIQPTPQTSSPALGSLSGVILERGGGRGVVGAEVRLRPGSGATVTEADGRFHIAGIQPGHYQLAVSALGYEEASVPVAVEAGISASVRIEVPPVPLPLDAIVIEPGSFGLLDVSPAAMGTTISRKEIEAVPQIGDDVFRTTKRLPGVTTGDISAKLNVRGGTERDLLVRLDGLELYEPYHLKDLDGVFGIVDVQALGSIDLITGGYPAQFGDKWGGVFDMRTRTPPAVGTRTTLGASLSSLSFINQGTFQDGRGQWLASLRRGFFQYVLKVTDVGDRLSPTFWDALGRAQYALSDNHILSVETLHAGDNIDWHDEETGLTVGSRWTNTHTWMTWKASFAPWLHMQTALSAGQLSRDREGSGGKAGCAGLIPLSSRVQDVGSFHFRGVKQDWQVDLGKRALLKAGVDLRSTDASYDYFGTAAYCAVTSSGSLTSRADTNAVTVAPRSDDVSAYVAARVQPLPAWTGEVGLRLDRESQTGERDIGPRVLVRWDPGPRTSVKASWGRYFEPQRVQDLAVMDGESTFSHSERADQVAVGVEWTLPLGFSARVEGYTRTVSDPRPLWVNLARQINPLLEIQSDRARLDPTRARASGLELLVSREGVGPWSWSASYVLARSEQEIEEVWVPVTQDQRHTINLSGEIRPWARWQFSAAWQYHTGWPVTDQTLYGEIVDDNAAGSLAVVTRRTYGPLNRDRLPPYHRLDIRATRTFDFRRSHLETYLDIFNVYDRPNMQGYEYQLGQSPSGSFLTARSPGEQLLPILPTVGFRWVF